MCIYRRYNTSMYSVKMDIWHVAYVEYLGKYMLLFFSIFDRMFNVCVWCIQVLIIQIIQLHLIYCNNVMMGIIMLITVTTHTTVSCLNNYKINFNDGKI